MRSELALLGAYFDVGSGGLELHDANPGAFAHAVEDWGRCNERSFATALEIIRSKTARIDARDGVDQQADQATDQRSC